MEGAWLREDSRSAKLRVGRSAEKWSRHPKLARSISPDATARLGCAVLGSSIAASRWRARGKRRLSMLRLAAWVGEEGS